MDRVILHSDVNNFYASVECLYNPEIAHLPVAVCGSQSKRHGIVLAKNKIAKAFGVQTAEPIVSALQKCPKLHIVPPHGELYQRFSRQINEIYCKYTDRVEPFSIDESWLDVTRYVSGFDEGVRLADTIRREIDQKLGMNVSIGVSWNKVFAKLGGDLADPDSVLPISRENYTQVAWLMPARRLLYVGPATERRLARLGIGTIGCIANANPAVLHSLLGKWGHTLYAFANGLENSAVRVWGNGDIVKSIGNSTTTPRDITNDTDAKQVVYMLSESVAERMREQGFAGKVVQVWLRDTNLCGQEHQEQLHEPTQVSERIAQAALRIIHTHWDNKPLRSLGVRVSALERKQDEWQLGFFSDEEKLERLEGCIDDLRSRYGHWSMRRAITLLDTSLNINPREDNITSFSRL